MYKIQKYQKNPKIIKQINLLNFNFLVAGCHQVFFQFRTFRKKRQGDQSQHFPNFH